MKMPHGFHPKIGVGEHSRYIHKGASPPPTNAGVQRRRGRANCCLTSCFVVHSTTVPRAARKRPIPGIDHFARTPSRGCAGLCGRPGHIRKHESPRPGRCSPHIPSPVVTFALCEASISFVFAILCDSGIHVPSENMIHETCYLLALPSNITQPDNSGGCDLSCIGASWGCWRWILTMDLGKQRLLQCAPGFGW